MRPRSWSARLPRQQIDFVALNKKPERIMSGGRRTMRETINSNRSTTTPQNKIVFGTPGSVASRKSSRFQTVQQSVKKMPAMMSSSSLSKGNNMNRA